MDVVAPGICVLPVRTPTLPPATHTNCYVVGEGELAVFDPASPWEDGRAALATALAARIGCGERLVRIVLTHHHHDHVAGALDLRERLGVEVPVVAHRATAALLPGVVDEYLDEGDPLDIGGRSLAPLHTPGHAPGHLVFHDRESGAVIAGDMVAGIGTIGIDPADGDLGDYLASLARMKDLGASVLLPSHGPALTEPAAILGFYIAHRHARTEQIRAALDRRGAASATELASEIYAELAVPYLPLAARQIVSHLRWLASHGLAEGDGDLWRLRR